jgi:hypothetical protein
VLQCNINAAVRHFKGYFVQRSRRALDEAPGCIARAAMDVAADQIRQRRGLLIVLSSPSGAGKTTLSRMLMEADTEITMSVSVTTRPKRPGEAEGVDYHFVDDDEFDRWSAQEFVEWAPVFGYRYGTPKAPVKLALKDGRDILFDIDWQGRNSSRLRWGKTSSQCSCCLRQWRSSSGACESAAPTLKL